MPRASGDANEESTKEKMREQYRLFTDQMKEGKSFSGKERNCVYLNMGNTKFANVSAITGLDLLDDGRGLAVSDWDLDGDVDLLLTNRTGPQFRFLRNDLNSANGFVSFKLFGNGSNRDAIGARIMLTLSNGETLSKTVSAGTGFLSQSSKRIVFGLAQGNTVTKVVIRWPGWTELSGTFPQADGSRSQTPRMETVINNLENNAHYEIRQVLVATSKVLEGDTLPGPNVKTFERPQPASLERGAIPPAKYESVSTVVAPPITMPLTDYSTETGQSKSVVFDSKFTLVNTWASWCSPCLKELKEFSDNYSQLSESGVRIVALSTDGLPGQDTKLADAQAAAKRLNFPFEWGIADSKWIDKMSLLRGELFDVRQPYPLPTSFLVDDRGRIRMIYQGGISIEKLKSDIQRISLGQEDELRTVMTPFGGQWVSLPRQPDDLGLRGMFADRGFEDDAKHYDERASGQKARLMYKTALDEIAANSLAAGEQNLRGAIDLDPSFAPAQLVLANMYSKSAQREQGSRAVELLKTAKSYYQTVVKLESDNFDGNLGLGIVLARLNEQAAAIKHLKQAIEAKPDKWEARVMLSKLLATQNKVDEATSVLQNGLNKGPSDGSLEFELAGLLIKQKKYQEAMKASRLALEQNNDRHEFVVRLGDCYFLAGDAKKAKSLYQSTRLTQEVVEKLTWIYSVSADAKLRNKDEAKRNALQLVRSNSSRPLVKEVAAAAFAEAGDFQQAVQVQAMALQMMKPESPGYVAAERRLTLYRAGKPYRQTDNTENPFIKN